MGHYRELASSNLTYNARAKRYAVTPEFQPRHLTISAHRYLAQLRAAAEGVIGLQETWIGFAPDAQAMPVPSRRVDALLFRDLLAIMREGGSVEVNY